MNLGYAIFLGCLQGATEFLPISSSAHLALAESFLGIRQGGLPFDVSLHLGTLIAILAYFYDDFLIMAKALIFFKDRDPRLSRHRRLAFFVMFATVPGVVAGLFLENASETTLRQPLIIACALAGAGALLLWGEKRGKHLRDFKALTFVDAMLIGLAQALAIIPGVSRSGITMTAGLFRDLDRQAVARFSFLLSAPIIFGAGVYSLPKIAVQGLEPGNLPFYLTGFVSSAFSGYLCIAFLLRFIRTRTFAVFAYYRFLLAGLVMLALL